jgi:hypothetical protein
MSHAERAEYLTDLINEQCQILANFCRASFPAPGNRHLASSVELAMAPAVISRVKWMPQQVLRCDSVGTIRFERAPVGTRVWSDPHANSVLKRFPPSGLSCVQPPPLLRQTPRAGRLLMR